MELITTASPSRVLLEKADNGIIVSNLNESDEVTSKFLYEIYYKDGILNYDNIGAFVYAIMDTLFIPIQEPETNRKFEIYVTKIDESDDNMTKTESDDDE